MEMCMTVTVNVYFMNDDKPNSNSNNNTKFTSTAKMLQMFSFDVVAMDAIVVGFASSHSK